MNYKKSRALWRVWLKFILEKCVMALLVLEDITFTGKLPQTTHILHV